MNKTFRYKVGDRAKIVNDINSFGSWANCIVVIEGLKTNTLDRDYNISREKATSIYKDTGTVKEEWLIPLTREIKIFEDE